MGSCLSKKSTNSFSAVEKPSEQIKSNVQVVATVEEEKKKVEEETVKKEIFVIKHRKSNEIERKPVVVVEEKCEVKKGAEVTEMAKNCSSNNNSMNGCSAAAAAGVVVTAAVAVSTAPVRTSSCTKEEVDAILIQCGRLSRSSSTGKTVTLSASAAGSGENGNSVQRGRKYSGSKRSYDFDHENGSDGGDRRRGNGGSEIDGCEDNTGAGDDDDNAVAMVGGERSNRHRQRQRQSRSVSSPSSSKGRRRTPSRERDQAQQQQQRSGSRERVSNGSGRRVSRSPGRRSESPITTSGGVTATNTSSSANANGCNNGGGCKPGKMVSVPATVSSLAMDNNNNNNKSNNVGGTETISASAVKRIQVKRNVGCDSPMVSRTVGSPRARSPARMNAARISSENHNYSNSSAQNLQQQQQQQQQQPTLSLSRSNSRKAEQSPYRRNPLAEIDNNVVAAVEQMHLPGLKAPVHADNAVTDKRVNKTIVDKNLVMNVGCKAKEQQHSVTEEIKNSQSGVSNNVAVNVVGSGSEILKSSSHGGVTRSRSSRLSRDLDINPEALSNAAAPSYTALLLEDIQNFHQKNTNTPAFTLPACVSKACSILEAVADLNSSTGSNYSASAAAAAAAFADDKRRIPLTTHQFGTPVAGKKGGVETKDPFMQSEVAVGDDDDLMEPSFHKYVTVRRGGGGGGTLSGEEDVEDQESSGSNSFVSGHQQQHWASSSWEPNSADSTDCWTSSSSSRSNCREDSRSSVVPFQRFGLSSSDQQQQQNGIGRGRLGGSRGIQSLPAAAAI